MQNIIQRARHVDKPGDVVMVKFKLRQRKQMFDIPHASGEQIIHGDHMVSFMNEPVAEVGTEEAGATGNQDFFH